MNGKKIKVLVFIGSLQCGGKERRLVELMTFLKKDPRIEFSVVVTRDKVQYTSFFDLGIPYHVIPKSFSSYDPSIFRKFYKICKDYQPDLIHSWGRIQTLYALPAAKMLRIPLCNGQITLGLKPKEPFYLGLIDKLNYACSDLVLTNSVAGLKSFAPPVKKSKVIYNGINMDRFINLPPKSAMKRKYGITTTHAVIMSASFNGTKDYDLFCRVAGLVTAANPDVTFIGVGDFNKSNTYYERIKKYSDINPRALFPGKIQDVEALVNACTVGVLFSATEGISNAILEYMALGKPVIASDSGGNNELISDGINGFLIGSETDQQIADRILSLLDNPVKCGYMGDRNRDIIHQKFRNNTMGEAYMEVYTSLLSKTRRVLIDIKHPAQLNLFRTLAIQLRDNGWKVVISYLDRGKIPLIIRKEFRDFEVIKIGGSKGTKWSIIWDGNIKRTATFMRVLRKQRYDICVAASSIPLAVACRMSGVPVIQFYDDPERKRVNAINARMSDQLFFPPIVTKTDKISIFNCLKEWSYLSPRRFVPNPLVLEQYGLLPHQYVFVREVSNKSFNYFGQEDAIVASFSSQISKQVKVVLSLEDKKNASRFPAHWIQLEEPVSDIHSLIYYSKLLVSSGDSMAREASMLGVPSIYCGTRVMKANQLLSDLNILEHLPGDTAVPVINSNIARVFDIKGQSLIRNSLLDKWDDMVLFMEDQVNHYKKAN